MPHCGCRQPAGTFTIASDRLSVALARPGSEAQKGSRFDLTGHAVQVTLDGAHTYCAPETEDEARGSGGLGLCNEFFDFTETLYNSAGAGERFPKMGVGLLRRGTEDYFFMTHYVKEPYPIDVAAGEGEAVFTVRPVPCNGYAAKLVKRVSVASNVLLFEYDFANAGEKPIELLEYNHNFVCIDGRPVGPGYRFRLPYPVEMDAVPDELSVQGNEITWKRVPQGDFYCRPQVGAYEGEHMWELVAEPGGVGLRETDCFPVGRFALWGRRHVVSPEAFLHLRLGPGESLRWRRKYEFFAGGAD